MSWRRLAVMPSTPVQSLVRAFAWFRRHPAPTTSSRDRTRARRRAFQRSLQATGPPLRLRARPAVPTGHAPKARWSVWWATAEHFFQRCRDFESWAHLGQLLEAWLLEVSDRLHGTVKEVVAEPVSSASDRPSCHFPRIALIRAPSRPGTRVGRLRQRGGNRYSVPSAYCGQMVTGKPRR